MNMFRRALDRMMRRRGAYQDTFSRPSGRDVLADLQRKFGGVSYVADDDGGRKTAFNEGTRYVVRHIAAMVGMSDAELEELAREELDERGDGWQHGSGGYHEPGDGYSGGL